MSPQGVVDRVLAHKTAIQAAAQKHGLPWEVLAGLVANESGGIPWAARYEKNFRWLWRHDGGQNPLIPPQCTAVTEETHQKTSWGLCQVMGATARQMGKKGWLTELCQPHVGLEYGAAYLSQMLGRAQGDTAGALLKYNGGGDQGYPDRVLAWAARIKAAA